MSAPSFSSGSKSLRLSFKGDKPLKKRKRDKHRESSSSTSTTDPRARSRKRRSGQHGSDVEDVGGNEQAWVDVESELDLVGPCFIFQPTTNVSEPSSSFCIGFQPTLQEVEAALVVPEADDATNTEQDRASLLASNPKLAEELDGAEIVSTPETFPQAAPTLEPQSVYQVWIATRVPGSTSPIRFTFKSAEGKFLGSDKNGMLTASQEARGPQEEWILERCSSSSSSSSSSRLTGRWMLRSVHSRYLTLDQVAGGKSVVRADFEKQSTSNSKNNDDPTSTWNIKVQWKHRHAARHSASDPSKSISATKSNDPTILHLGPKDQILQQELETFRSRAGSQYLPSNYASTLSKEERRALRKAEKEGRLAEEMLDRRSKLKSDKYA